MSNNEELFGDKLERRLKQVGADKVVEKVEKITGKPCGCAKRKKFLNDVHRKIIKR